jgi:RimJ/RimL family protein N-acetyltransferase
LLEGKNVNLRVMEKEDIDFLDEFNNDVDSRGEYEPIDQMSKSEQMKQLDAAVSSPSDFKLFIIQKKDGTRIGEIYHRLSRPFKGMEIVYMLIPKEWGKGFGTEAVQLMVDYLFLSKDHARIQAIINVGNKASQRVLEKSGFQREGTMRKCIFSRGELRDYHLYSILREEWKEPKILTKTA